MRKCIFAVGLMACAGAASAEALVDFVRDVDKVRLTGGVYTNAADRAKQVEATPKGLRMTFDSERMKADRWNAVSIDAALGAARDWKGLEVDLVMRERSLVGVTRGMVLNFMDRDGEIFQYQPCGIEEDLVTDEVIVSFRVDDPFRGKAWAVKRNGVPDAPLRLISLNGHFAGPGRDREMTLVRIERRASENAAERSLTLVEPVSVDTTYPGARPFRRAESLTLRVTPAFCGTAVMTVSENNMRSAAEGMKKTLTCTTNVPTETLVFKTDLPMSRAYHYLGTQFRPASGASCGAYRVVSAEGCFRSTAAEAFRLSVETGNPLHIARTEKPAERPVIWVRNPAGQRLRWKTTLCLSDAFGRKLEIPFDRTVGPGEAVRVDVPWPLPAKGIWFVTAQVEGEDGSRARHRTGFAWIDLHERTPQTEMPKFRCGIHYHGIRYLPDLVDPTIEAMVSAGAKFTRTDYGFMFGDVYRREGVADWSLADDLLKRMRAAGLSLEIIVGGTPAWAVDPVVAATAKGLRRQGCCPSRPGLFRAFCREIAARYGRQIDYYEIGNEWDITSPKVLPPDEALRMQREAYEGIHAGCPEAIVIPNGWGYVTSKGLSPETHNPGLIERFAAHPELYDAWSIHSHGPFRTYVERLQGEFLPLRDTTALKARPWISGETALSNFGTSEIVVARAVWEKILYAWAWGARDYIWYNLRATGWLPGREPDYGLITADFHPRAGYAAFAALTTVFQGLDFDRRLVSEPPLHVLAFKGEKPGFRGRVVAFWQTAGTRRVRLVTDAASAVLCDHMGNRAPFPLKDGMVTLETGVDPKALLLEGASWVALD